MTCSNCSAEAVYALENERVSPVYYCGKHLPVFLRMAASKGQLTIPAPVESTAETASSKKKSKTVSAPDPEPVVEEPVLVEEPAPVVEEPEATEA